MSRFELENNLVLDLVQAMLGAVSGNFRRVSVELVNDEVRLQFVLLRESEEDREEISDIVFEFEALQGTATDVFLDVQVSTHELSEIPCLRRPVFARRET